MTGPIDAGGVGFTGGRPYFSETVEEVPDSPGEIYRVETYVEHAETGIRTVYYLPGRELHEFFREYRLTDERVIDVRPVALEDAEAELEAYQEEDSE